MFKLTWNVAIHYNFYNYVFRQLYEKNYVNKYIKIYQRKVEQDLQFVSWIGICAVWVCQDNVRNKKTVLLNYSSQTSGFGEILKYIITDWEFNKYSDTDASNEHLNSR